MTARHLVADAQLALAGDINFDLLDDSRFDLLAALYPVGRAVAFELQFGELVLICADDFTDSVPNRTWIDLDVIVRGRQFSQKCFRDFSIRRNDDLTGLGVDNVERNFFAQQNVRE